MIWWRGLSGWWILADLTPNNTDIVPAAVVLGLAALSLGFLSFLRAELPVLGPAAARASAGAAGSGGCNANPPGCRVRQTRYRHYLGGGGTR